MITFTLELEGLARRLMEVSPETTVRDGLNVASMRAKRELEINFEVGGRPSWGLTKDGNIPLNKTGQLKDACSSNAQVDLGEESFDVSPSGDQKVVEIQAFSCCVPTENRNTDHPGTATGAQQKGT